MFECLNDWNIIILVRMSKNNTEKDDEVFGNILRGVETRMNKNILSNMTGAMIINDESIGWYYGVQ